MQVVRRSAELDGFRLARIALACLIAVLGILVGGAPSALAAGEPRIAFISARESSEVFVMAADGSGEVAVTHRAPEAYGAAWSPDGSRIAFTGLAASHGPLRLWVMTRAGADLHPITRLRGDTTGGVPGFDPDWSPTGRRLVFSYAYDIFTARADGTDLRRLTDRRRRFGHDDWDPAWSPNGRWIVFTRDARLYKMWPDGSHLTLLRRGEAADWSPSGRRIVYTIWRRSGARDLVTMKPDGSDVRRLTNTPRIDEGEPAWSPRGKLIAYSRGFRSLWVIGGDGRGARRIVSNGLQPTWSPSGSSLAFSRRKSARVGDNLDPMAAIFSLRLKTSALTKILAPELDTDVAASPDGAQIAYTSVRPFSRSGIYVADADGANERFLHGGESPDWSPDGSQILLLGRDGLFLVDSDGSDPVHLAVPILDGKLIRGVAEPEWRPDGGAVSFVGRLSGCRDVFTMALDGSDVARITSTDCEPKINTFDWTPDGGSLVFSGQTCLDFDCAYQIFSAPVPGGTATALTERNVDLFDERPAVSPDGTQVVFERGDATVLFTSSVWVMSVDGSAETKLTSAGSDAAPTWLP